MPIVREFIDENGQSFLLTKFSLAEASIHLALLRVKPIFNEINANAMYEENLRNAIVAASNLGPDTIILCGFKTHASNDLIHGEYSFAICHPRILDWILNMTTSLPKSIKDKDAVGH